MKEEVIIEICYNKAKEDAKWSGLYFGMTILWVLWVVQLVSNVIHHNATPEDIRSLMMLGPGMILTWAFFRTRNNKEFRILLFEDRIESYVNDELVSKISLDDIYYFKLKNEGIINERLVIYAYHSKPIKVYTYLKPELVRELYVYLEEHLKIPPGVDTFVRRIDDE